jgi:hypothetical protein
MALSCDNKTVRWPSGLVALGLALRLFHYLRDPPVWQDEAFLILNLLGKGFADLLGPLDYNQAAPPLFLWAERTAVLLLGDSTLALRLLPCAASCLALLIMVPLARRLLHPEAVPWALLLFACSDMLLWHACEAKPYSFDVLAAVVLLMAVCCRPASPLVARIAVLALLAPVLMLSAYPSCFLYGGVLVGLLPAVWRARTVHTWSAYGLLVLAVFVTFGALVTGPVHAQRNDALVGYWQGISQFPSWRRPWSVAGWTVVSSFEIGRYVCKPTGQALAVLAVVGAVRLARRGLRVPLATLGVPIALALLASYVGAYPYGGSRLLVYAAPAVVLLTAEGVQPAFDWLRARTLAGPIALTALLQAPLALALYHLAVPWSRPDWSAAAAYVLAHRAPRDQVTANNHESLYYFRCLGPDLARLTDTTAPASRHWWLLISGGTPDGRLHEAEAYLPSHARALERYEFDRISVFLCSTPRR